MYASNSVKVCCTPTSLPSQDAYPRHVKETTSTQSSSRTRDYRITEGLRVSFIAPTVEVYDSNLLPERIERTKTLMRSCRGTSNYCTATTKPKMLHRWVGRETHIVLIYQAFCDRYWLEGWVYALECDCSDLVNDTLQLANHRGTTIRQLHEEYGLTDAD